MSQVVLIIVWPFPHLLDFFQPWQILCRMFWGSICFLIPPLGVLPGYRSWSPHVPYHQCCESQLRSPPLHFFCTSFIPGLCLKLETQPPPQLHQFQISISSHDYLAISPVPSHTWSILLSLPSPIQFLTSVCLLWLFYSLFCVRVKHLHLGLSSCSIFWGLWVLWRVSCSLEKISTYPWGIWATLQNHIFILVYQHLRL